MKDINLISTQFKSALLAIDKSTANSIVQNVIRFLTPIEIANELIAKSLEEIGCDWEKGDIGLAQVYMAGKICEELVDTILPPTDPNRKNQPKTAIVVLEDYHLLGKRIVYSGLRAGGFELMDFGTGVLVDDLVKKVIAEKIEILLVSTLMLPSALKVKNLKNKLNGCNVKIVVGGAPFRLDPELWKEVGADAFGYNASDAISLVNQYSEDK
ncbi:MAG: cobalamin-dependent protein [bacterium]